MNSRERALINSSHNEKQPLLSLPNELFTSVIPFDSKTVRNLNLVSTYFSFFNSDQKTRKAFNLIKLIRGNNISDVCKVINTDHMSIFTHVNYYYTDGINELISPLQYAYKIDFKKINEEFGPASNILKAFEQKIHDKHPDCLHLVETQKNEYNPKKFLFLTKMADYDSVEKMLDDNLELMFTEIETLNADGITEKTTAIKESVRLLDTYMWQLFENKINEKNPARLLEFEKQMQEQKEYINPEPFFQAYEKFIKQCDHYSDNKITKNELEAHCREFSIAQNDFVAKCPHAWNEFCRQNHASWGAMAAFSLKVHGRPKWDAVRSAGMRNSQSYRLLELLPEITAQRSLYLLSRGEWGQAYALFLPQNSHLGCYEVDLAAFKRLFSVRKNDLNERLSTMLSHKGEHTAINYC